MDSLSYMGLYAATNRFLEIFNEKDYKCSPERRKKIIEQFKIFRPQFEIVQKRLYPNMQNLFPPRIIADMLFYLNDKHDNFTIEPLELIDDMTFYFVSNAFEDPKRVGWLVAIISQTLIDLKWFS